MKIEKIIIGDKIKISNRNKNHLGNDVSAYANMEGIVENIYRDGSFVLNCGSAILVCPKINGMWLIKKGKEFFYK